MTYVTQQSRPAGAGVQFTRSIFKLSVGLLLGASLLITLTHRGNCELSLTPSSVVHLCPGDQLHLTCNSSSFGVSWTVYDTNNGMNYSALAGALPSSGITRPSPLPVGSFTFNIASQVVNNTGSSQHSLISNVTVDNVNIALNATVITCTEDATEIQDMVTVNVIDTNEFMDFSPNVLISESDPVFGISNVTVDITIQHSNLSSTYVSSLVMFNITTFQVDLEEYVQRIDSLIFKVIVPYNVHVQVNTSIVPTLCGRSGREVTFNTSFYYTTCGYPAFSNLTYTIEEMSVDTIPATYRSTFNITCPPGLVLTGPNTTTCMENGEWEPDPRQAKCIVSCGHPEFSDSALDVREMSVGTIPVSEGSMFTFTCPPGLILTGPNTTTCMENGEWEPDPQQAECIGSKADMSQVVIIIASSLGTVFLFVISLSTVPVIIFILKKRKVLSHGTTKQKSISRFERVQYEHSSQENVIINENTSAGYRTLVYADLGPGLSSKQPRPLVPNFDDFKTEYATINYKLISDQNEVTNITDQVEDHPADKLLNLDTLLMQLQGQVTLQWYEFGKALRVEEEELIKATELPSDQSIIEILDHWIRNHTGPPTWKEIASALSKLNLHNLSLEIDRIYTEGKLVVENDEGCSMPTGRDVTSFSKEEPPPIPSKYSMVSLTTPDTDPQDCIQQSTSLNEPGIPPKLPPKTYTHQVVADFEVEVAPARPPKPNRV